MSFYTQWLKLTEQPVSERLLQATPAQVEHALAVTTRTLDDFAALLSPAAAAYLPQMANMARALTRQQFGPTVRFYLPLYLTNLCANDCTYCGFSARNALRRTVLDESAVRAECEAMTAQGFDSLLLVSGEHERAAGMPYFRRMLPVVRPYAANLSMEVQPLATAEYAELRTLGLDGVLVYQETYDAEVYAAHHLRGRKRDFRWRLETPDRLGQAGMEKVGLGVLLGLGDWRQDTLRMAHHLRYLQNTWWRTRYAVAFPRLRPSASGFSPPHPVSDRQLLQLVSAWRLFDPTIELSLSTREPATLRDVLVESGISHASAGSQTRPGGYAQPSSALDQFEPGDHRTAAEVAARWQQQGIEVIWHEAGVGGFAQPCAGQ